MYKLSIINNVNGRTFGASFETNEEAQSWKQEQINKESWGLNAYSEKLDSEAIPKAGYISSNICVLSPALGEDPEVQGIEYFYETEYTVTEEDLSLNAEYVAAQALQARKNAYATIDDLLKEALVEKELGNSAKWDAYILLRNDIKTNNPL